MTDPLPIYLTPEQVADLLPFGNATWVRTRIHAGDLTAYKVGGRWLTTTEHVREFIEAGVSTPRAGAAPGGLERGGLSPS